MTWLKRVKRGREKKMGKVVGEYRVPAIQIIEEDPVFQPLWGC
jgi:hypothetical protein